MGMTIQEAKHQLRARIRELKRRQEATLLAHSSQELCLRVLSHPRVKSAQVVMAYHSLPDEADTHALLDALLAEGKTVLLPQVTGAASMVLRKYTGKDSLREGAYGIMEPTGALFADYDCIDAAIVPGMAFDAVGHRLGRGKGYYDRLLPLLPRAYKIGICHAYQLVESVAHEEHDIRMDEVVRDEGLGLKV